MKYVLIVLLLAGCGVSDIAIKEAEKLCADHGGIDFMYGSTHIVNVNVVCKDETPFETKVKK